MRGARALLLAARRPLADAAAARRRSATTCSSAKTLYLAPLLPLARARRGRARRARSAASGASCTGSEAGGSRRSRTSSRRRRTSTPGRLVAGALPAPRRRGRRPPPAQRRRADRRARPQEPARPARDRRRRGAAARDRGRALDRGAGTRSSAGRRRRRTRRGQDLLDCVVPVFEEARAEQERQALERWREEAGRDGRAASGWAADARGRVGRPRRAAARRRRRQPRGVPVPACGRVPGRRDGTCPLDGTPMEPRRDGLDLAVHQTLEHGGDDLASRAPAGSRPGRGHRRAAAVLARVYAGARRGEPRLLGAPGSRRGELRRLVGAHARSTAATSGSSPVAAPCCSNFRAVDEDAASRATPTASL